ncbi:uncharacterized protein TNCV_2902391 [Trichonephila clavipes]|nr:uncharacterized protein TNCV_2902391 [Trichonephila clavipes]
MFTTGSPHTNTIGITAEIESEFVAKDDLAPFRCSPVSFCAAPLQTEASIGGVKESTGNGHRDPKRPSARRLRMVREDTGASSDGATCAWMVADVAVGCTRAFLTIGGHLDVWRRFVEWAQNEIAVVPDLHKRILFSDEAHFWLNGYVNKQNCHIWREANPQVYVETPLHPEKLTVRCALWAGGIIGQYFFKNDEGHNVTVNGDRYRAMITNFFHS